MIDNLDRQGAQESFLNKNWTLSFWEAKTKPEVQNMHPKTASITMEAHVRDLQRAMQPQRSRRPRRRLAWIRKSR